MRNQKDLKLVDIYIRIHNRQVLTMDDLAYLAKYNPVCFKKTCDNLIYKKQETKVTEKTAAEIPEKTIVARVRRNTSPKTGRSSFEVTAEDKLQNNRVMEQLMESFKKIESGGFGRVSTLQNIDMSQMQELLGDLFEGSPSDNGAQVYFNAVESGSRFNVRV